MALAENDTGNLNYLGIDIKQEYIDRAMSRMQNNPVQGMVTSLSAVLSSMKNR